MNTVPFDTLKFADRLAAGGFTEEQAKTAASALSETFKDDIATKADIERLEAKIDTLESSMNQKLGALESSVNQKLGALENSMNQKLGTLESSMNQKLGTLEAILTQKIDAMESRITIKMGGMLVVAIGVIVSLLKLIH